MVEIRDKNNKVITKEEIRKEFGNEVDNLRKNLLTGQDYNIINKVYNINNDINILSIDLGRNYFKFNDISFIHIDISFHNIFPKKNSIFFTPSLLIVKYILILLKILKE